MGHLKYDCIKVNWTDISGGSKTSHDSWKFGQVSEEKRELSTAEQQQRIERQQQQQNTDNNNNSKCGTKTRIHQFFCGKRTSEDQSMLFRHLRKLDRIISKENILQL